MKKNYFLAVFFLLPFVCNDSWSMEFAKKEASTPHSMEKRRPILEALDYEEHGPQLNPLVARELFIMAELTESSLVHISGNCGLLARAMLHNLKQGRVQYSVANTWPLTQGIEVKPAEMIIFGKHLSLENKEFRTVSSLVEDLKTLHLAKGKKFFIIEILDKSSSFLNLYPSHDLNAVVYCENQVLKVLFVDAWKSFNKVMTVLEFESQYPEAIFWIVFED